MIHHRTWAEVRRYDIIKLLILVLLIALLIILALTGNGPGRTAVSDTAPTFPDADAVVDAPTPPTLDIPDSAFTPGAVLLSGTGAPGAEVAIIADGDPLGTATVGSDGTWSFTTDLPAGVYEVQAGALDAGGNVLAASDAVSVRVAAPLATPTLDLPETELTAGAYTLRGTGTPGSVVEVLLDGVSIGSAVVDENGRWSLDMDLSAGSYDLSAVAGRDGAETAAAAPIPLTISPAFAVPTIDTPRIDPAAEMTTLSGSGMPGSTIDILVNGDVIGSATVNEDGAWTLEATLPGGAYDLTAQATSADGSETAAAEPLALNVPIKPTLSLPDEGFAAGAVTLTGAGAPGEVMEILIDGEVVGSTTVREDGTWLFDLELATGDYEVAARVVDDSGSVIVRSDSTQLSVTPAAVTEEAAAPTLTEPAEGAALAAGDVTLAGTGAPGSEVDVLEDGVIVGTAVVDDAGQWTFTLPAAAGDHTYSVRPAGSEIDTATVSATVATAEPGTETAAAAAVCNDPAPGIDQGDTYVVGECEWLVRIAGRLGIAYEDLIAVNPQIENPDIVYPGQVINLPPR